jgi:acyl carrier protein
MTLAYQEFASELATILEEQACDLTRDRELLSIPMWDSLAVVSVMALASDKFDRILEPEQLTKAKTVGDLFDMIDRPTSAP